MAQQDNYEDKIIKVAEVLELGSPIPSGDSLQARCPFHDDHTPSWGVHKSEGMYNCFACTSSGHFNKLAEDLRGHISAETIDNIEDFRISAKVDTRTGYEEKPSKKDMAKIRCALHSENVKRYRVDDLVTLIVGGHSVCPSGANSNKEWQSQQCVMLDFDNKESNFTMQEVLDYASTINKTPTFAYHTFSHTDEKPKFRFVYCLKEPITVKEQMQAIIIKLLKLFKDYGPDMACKDFCRLFLGTNKDRVGDLSTSNFIYSGTRFSMEQLDEVERIIGVNSDGPPSIKIKHEEVAQELINEFHIRRLNTLTHFYNAETGLYVNNSERELERIIKRKFRALGQSIGKNTMSEILNDLELMAENATESDYRIVCCKNTLVNIETLETIPFTPDIIVTSRIEVDYIPLDIENCSNPVVDKFMADISNSDEQLERLLYEIMRILLCEDKLTT